MTSINNDYTAFIKYLDTLKIKNNSTDYHNKVIPTAGIDISKENKVMPTAGIDTSKQNKVMPKAGIDTTNQNKVMPKAGIDTTNQNKVMPKAGIDTTNQNKESETPINTITPSHTDIDSIEKRKMLEKSFNEHFMIDDNTISNSQTDKSVNTDKKRQILEDLFNKKMTGELSETSINPKKKKDAKKDEKNKLLIDALKYESKRFDKLCINNAIVGYSNINNMCILEIDKLLYNVKMYISHNKKYKNFVIYKNKGIYYLLTKKELTKLDDKYTKFLKICLKQFSEKDKFRKVINKSTYRCCNQVYTLHKTNLEEIELIICTKINNDDL